MRTKSAKLALPKLALHVNESELLELLNDPSSHTAPLPGSSPQPHLRHWVDEWLKSGLTPEGGEKPRMRHFRMKIDQDALERMVWKFSADYLRAIPEDNELKLRLLPLKKGRDGKPLEAELHAQMLLRLMASDLRFRIAKCRNCSTYYLLSLRPGPLDKGARCVSCYKANRGTEQKARMEERRKASSEALWTLVAKHFSEVISGYPEWYRDRKLVEKIVRGINKELLRVNSPRDPITSKWVVREANRNGINAAIRSLQMKSRKAA